MGWQAGFRVGLGLAWGGLGLGDIKVCVGFRLGASWVCSWLWVRLKDWPVGSYRVGGLLGCGLEVAMDFG